MERFKANECDAGEILSSLTEHGYAVIESILSASELNDLKVSVESMLASERTTPFDPGDGPAAPEDEEIEAYLSNAYRISSAERDRVMKRIRHARAHNHGTKWPVGAAQINHSFMHIPLLLDDERTQRSYNLPAKLPQCARLIEDPLLLQLLAEMLKDDFILSDISATSIGPQTNGGYWHVDAPLTMLPEPLPDIVLAVQTVWMLDDFTNENGATRVVPGSHRTLKKPPWGYDPLAEEIALTAPAGSLAMWLSHTWHRVGSNVTNGPRRAVLGYFSQAWVKPFSDYTRSVPPEVMARYSPRARYMLGWSAFAPVRG